MHEDFRARSIRQSIQLACLIEVKTPKLTTFIKGVLPALLANDAPTRMGKGATRVAIGEAETLRSKQPSGVLPSIIRRRSVSATRLWTVRAFAFAVQVVDGYDCRALTTCRLPV